MKLFGLKDENGKEYVLNVTNAYKGNTKDINVYPIEPTPKLEIGKWYKYAQYIFRVESIDSELIYFDKECSYVIGEPKIGVYSGWADNCRLATASEIESHLIKVAGEKGYRNGVKIKGLRFNREGEMEWQDGKIGAEQYSGYYMKGDCLNVLDKYHGVYEIIYRQGKWATIIPDKKPLPKTKKELMHLLVHIAVHNSHQHVRETLDEYED